jgi:3-dehydroquinate synthase
MKLAETGRFLKNFGFSRNTLVVTDKNAGRLYAGTVLKSLRRAGFNPSAVTLEPGEKHKNISSVAKIYGSAVKAGLDRKSAIIALGGGVVGDLAGFAAATFMRGVPFVQLPTTLLAMVDSSVGGKTGFDLKEGKNLAGAFCQPKAVLIDLSTLKTLPARHVANGMAEVIKYGVIMDAEFFDYLEKKAGEGWDLEKIVFRSLELKASVVEKDEFEEKGLREILNFGHTFGHACETLSGYGPVLHGEAVAAGMAAAAGLSVKLGRMTAGESARLKNLLKKAGLPAEFKKKFKPSEILKVMLRDKKTRNGRLRLVLPSRIGKAEVVSGVPEKIIREVL